MADFRLQIVTKQRTVFDQNVTSLTMPGEEGFFGVLAYHAPIISVLKEGNVKMRRGLNEEEFHITGGFFEMERNVATLLADEVRGLESQEGVEE